MYFFIHFLFISVVGTILHFTYKLSKNNIVVGIFSAVNESVWEHIKLLLTPIFFINTLWYILGYKNNYFISLFTQLFLSIVLIILFYEIKILIFKDKKDYINIISFYIISLIVSIVGFVIYNVGEMKTLNILCMIGSLIIFIMYLTFTIFPPKNKYFKDPITGKYGINNM